MTPTPQHPQAQLAIDEIIRKQGEHENIFEKLIGEDPIKKESYPCHRCGEHGYKTDGKSRIWCKKCLGLLKKADTLMRNPRWQQRNEKCLCGSGKKFKHCCMNKVDEFEKPKSQ